MLRNEIIQNKSRNWTFDGSSFENLKSPPKLHIFLAYLLFGPHVQSAAEMRSLDVTKTVDVACQFLVQNMKTDRQATHKPKTTMRFKQTVQTPLSIGLPLTIHSRVRVKNIVTSLSDMYLGCDYRTLLELEKPTVQYCSEWQGLEGSAFLTSRRKTKLYGLLSITLT